MTLQQFRSRAAVNASAIFAVLLAGTALVGCSASADKPDPALNQSEEAFAGEDMELLAKVTAGAAPEDLVWSLPTKLPDGWERKDIPDEAVVQMDVSPRCIIQFRQPMGFDDPDTPDSAGVAAGFSEELGQAAFGTQITVVQEQQVMFEASINDGAMGGQFSFAKAGFTAEAEPGLGGTTYAYRAGDFALIAVALCGGGEYSASGEQMRAFVESARADVSY